MTASSPTARRRPGRPRAGIDQQALIVAARRLFAERGYRGTTVEAIASAMRVTKAAVLYHHSSKEALYRAVVDDLMVSLQSRIAMQFQAEGPFMERLDGLTDLIFDFFDEEPAAARLLVQELVGDGPYMQDGGRETALAVMRTIRDFLSSAATTNGGSPQATRVAAEQLTLSIASVHLLPFAAGEITQRFLGDSGSKFTSTRKAALRGQVRVMVRHFLEES